MNEELLEIAARKLCELRGADPDLTYRALDKFGERVDVPVWKQFAQLIGEHLDILEAIEEAVEHAKRPKP